MNLNGVLRDMESAPQERKYIKNEEGTFTKEVELAKKNLKNSLEITAYIEVAKSLLQKYSASELLDIGETDREELNNLCGAEKDSSVITAICFYLENQITQNQHN